STPTQCLAQLYNSKELVDLTIIIHGHDGHFKVHRLVLGMWSCVFQAMLFGPMAEGNTITLEEESVEAFSWLLNYMYTGQKEIPSVNLAIQIYLLANKYLMGHLKIVCSEYLQNNACAVSVPEILNIAQLLDDETLINKCTEVIEKTPDSFWSSPTIGALCCDSLEQLLKKDLPVSSESVIFQGVLNWGRAQLKSKEQEITTTVLRHEVEKFLPEIRFLAMNYVEFVKEVLPYPILTLKEVIAIQLIIVGVPDVSLPPLFSNNMEMRKFSKKRIKTCCIQFESLYKLDSTKIAISNPTILDNIQTEHMIYLSKLEHGKDIGYKGTLHVSDSSGKAHGSAQFDGKSAEFDMPLQLQPKEIYTFRLSGGEPTLRDQHVWTIKHNNLISGRKVNNYAEKCVLYYWKL
ncbi:unnamed protein product, partial [Meganyctiphanes norvegica]